VSSNFNSKPAPGQHLSASGLTFHQYELLVLATEAISDAQRQHKDAQGELDAWRDLLDDAA
jgi:hypothetical protein